MVEITDLVKFKIKMKRGLGIGAKLTLIFEEVFAEKMYPYPRSIGIYDLQYLWFEDRLHIQSPYVTKLESVRVLLPNEDV